MDENAISFAKQQEELMRKSLADLYGGLSQTRDASVQEAELKKQQLLSQIEQSRAPIQQQYEQNAQSAYVNKMLQTQNVDDLLNRLGLNTSGFGVGQKIGVDTSYGRNLNDLTMGRNTMMQDLTNQAQNVEGQQAGILAGINSSYAENKLNLDKYINERATDSYDKAYQNYIKEQQDKLNREFEERRFQEQIRNSNMSRSYYEPQSFKDQAMPYTLGATPVLNSKTGRVTYTDNYGNKYEFSQGVNPWTGGVNKDTQSNNVFDPNKVFNGASGGYQPNNIGGKKLTAVKAANGTENLKVFWDNAGQWQNVYTLPNGNHYVWDGKSNKYVQLSKAEIQRLTATNSGGMSGGRS